MKILVTCPHLDRLGGVANHYLGLKPYWTENIKYVEIGSRGNKSGTGKYWLVWDVLRFVITLIVFNADCVVLNPSIGVNALKRDFMFQKIANFFGRPTVIFIHGFNLQIFENLNKKWLSDNFNKAKLIFVLAKDFKDRLEKCGVTTSIETTTTKVDDKLIQDFDIRSRDGKVETILYLARVDRAKGVHETLDTFILLKKEFDDLKLNIVGDGPELIRIENRVKTEDVQDIIISGRLDGQEVAEAYKSASLLILLSYGEGMPTTVLEAMAFGLPVITRPVGGLVDFFENGRMGFMSDSLDPQVFAAGIRDYLLDEDLVKQTAMYNYEYAKKNFMASNVAKRIEIIIKKYISI